MSDTVLLSLITFASGFLGVLVGAVSNYLISKSSIRAERGRLLHDEKKVAYGSVVSAYLAVIDFIASHDSSMPGDDNGLIEKARQFFQAQTAAVLVAPPPVQSALFQAALSVQEMGNTWNTPKDSAVFAALAEAMRDDLLSF